MVVIKCSSEKDLIREFSLWDQFNPEEKYLYVPEFVRESYCYKQPEETEQLGLGPLV